MGPPPHDVPTEAWTRDTPVDAWRAYVRAAYASNPGQCPLDVTRDNIFSYNQGSMSFIEQDLRRVLPPSMAAQALDAMDRMKLRDAFDLRRNVVNLKKVLLHSWHTSEPTEKELRRMSTFWRGDMSWANGFVDVTRHREVCVAHMRCKGAAHAVFDGRVMTKAICCVPRHPDLERPGKLAGLPRTLTTHSWLDQALRTLSEMTNEKSPSPHWSPQGADPGAVDTFVDAMASASMDAESSEKILRGTGCAADVKTEPSDVRRQLDAFLADATSAPHGPMSDWPAHIVGYVELVMVARGGAKALSVRAETERYALHLSDVSDKFADALSRLREKVRSVEDVLVHDVGAVHGRFVAQDTVGENAVESLRLATRRDKTLNLLEGCSPATKELALWVAKIVDQPTTRLFVAGDGGRGTTADFVPEGFGIGQLISRHKAVSDKWGPELRRKIEAAVEGEWPPRTPLMYVTGKTECVRCGGQFGTLWIGNGRCCFRCEEGMRSRLECPVSKRCPSAAFCPHSLRCIACERWSCELCGVVCGDGEDVVATVECTDPHVVFIDFDRTLCTTKSGSSPLRGSHSLDRELWGLVRGGRWDVRVVTRNSHVDDIKTFMRRFAVNEGGDSPGGDSPGGDSPGGDSPGGDAPGGDSPGGDSPGGDSPGGDSSGGDSSFDAIPVHHVGKGVSKGAVIRGACDEKASVVGSPIRAVFVDDSAAELLDEEVAGVPGLTRVLFSRVLA